MLSGESSPYYMFHPLARQRIAADLPEVRLLVMLRDPVMRAYSAHSHEVARGFEQLGFAEALEAESERTAGEFEMLMAVPGYDSAEWQHHAYLARGRYVEQLRALEALVGRERIRVVDSDDFFSSPEREFEKVRSFLNLEPAENIRFERHNARQRSPLDPELAGQLRDYFLPYDEQLRDWWGRTPSWRRADPSF